MDLDHRSSIDFAAVQEPKEDAEKQYPAVDGNGPIHAHGGDDGAGGPEGEEDGDEPVGDREDVDGNAEAAELEGTPAHGSRGRGESFEEQHGGG